MTKQIKKTMNSEDAYNEIFKKTDNRLTHYRDDLEKWDKKVITEEYEGVPFLHGARDSGTNTMPLSLLALMRNRFPLGNSLAPIGGKVSGEFFVEDAVNGMETLTLAMNSSFHLYDGDWVYEVSKKDTKVIIDAFKDFAQKQLKDLKGKAGWKNIDDIARFLEKIINEKKPFTTEDELIAELKETIKKAKKTDIVSEAIVELRENYPLSDNALKAIIKDTKPETIEGFLAEAHFLKYPEKATMEISQKLLADIGVAKQKKKTILHELGLTGYGRPTPATELLNAIEAYRNKDAKSYQTDISRLPQTKEEFEAVITLVEEIAPEYRVYMSNMNEIAPEWCSVAYNWELIKDAISKDKNPLEIEDVKKGYEFVEEAHENEESIREENDGFCPSEDTASRIAQKYYEENYVEVGSFFTFVEDTSPVEQFRFGEALLEYQASNDPENNTLKNVAIKFKTEENAVMLSGEEAVVLNETLSKIDTLDGVSQQALKVYKHEAKYTSALFPEEKEKHEASKVLKSNKEARENNRKSKKRTQAVIPK